MVQLSRPGERCGQRCPSRDSGAGLRTCTPAAGDRTAASEVARLRFGVRFHQLGERQRHRTLKVLTKPLGSDSADRSLSHQQRTPGRNLLIEK